MWDPIGVAGTPEARDEYYSYLPQIFQMLIGNRNVDEIENYLRTIEVERMGINTSIEKKKQIAEILKYWKEFLESEFKVD